MEIKLAKNAIKLPLVGLVVAWVLFVSAVYSDLYIQPVYDEMGNWISEAQLVRPSTYLFLTGIAIFGFFSLIGQRWALRARDLAGVDQPLPRAAHRFGNLVVILSLAAGAVFAVGNFLSAFTRFGDRPDNLLIRLFDVYVPILLATALVVYILLRAFVFRKQVAKGEPKPGLSETEKALGLGYAVPILATAFAIILGLVVYDVTRTELQVWVWVVIQAIIATGILFGTRFAAKARAGKKAEPKQRSTLAAGAANLNFVLSIVFAGVVGVMSFAFGAGAVEKLRVWPQYEEGKENVWTWTVTPVTFKWAIEEMLPAIVLLMLVAFGTYFIIIQRNSVVPTLEPLVIETPKANGSAAKKNGGNGTKANGAKSSASNSNGKKNGSNGTARKKSL